MSDLIGARFDSSAISVSVHPDRNVECRFRLRNYTAGKDPRIVLDARERTATIQYCDVDGTPTVVEAVGQQMQLLRIPHIASVENITLRFPWPRFDDRDPLYAIGIPEDIPQPCSARELASDRRGRPRMSVELVNSTELKAGGVFLSQQDMLRSSGIEMIVAPGHIEPVSQTAAVLLSKGLQNTLTVGELSRVGGFYSRVHALMARFFDREVYSCVLLSVPGEGVGRVVARATVAINVTREQFGIGVSTDPHDFMLALKIAGAWWGGGARIHGPRGIELEAAFRTHAALEWVEYIGGYSARQQVVDSIRGTAGRGRLARVLELAEYKFDSVMSARVALSMEEWARDPSWMKEVRTFTGSCWGLSVRDTVVIEWLRSHGCSI